MKIKIAIIVLCLSVCGCVAPAQKYDPIADAALLMYSAQMLAPQYNNSVYGGYGAYNVYGNIPVYHPHTQTTCMTTGNMIQCW